MVIQMLLQFMCFASIQNSYPICLFAFHLFLLTLAWLTIIEDRKISSDCVCTYFVFITCWVEYFFYSGFVAERGYNYDNIRHIDFQAFSCAWKIEVEGKRALLLCQCYIAQPMYSKWSLTYQSAVCWQWRHHNEFHFR